VLSAEPCAKSAFDAGCELAPEAGVTLIATGAFEIVSAAVVLVVGVAGVVVLATVGATGEATALTTTVAAPSNTRRRSSCRTRNEAWADRRRARNRRRSTCATVNQDNRMLRVHGEEKGARKQAKVPVWLAVPPNLAAHPLSRPITAYVKHSVVFYLVLPWQLAAIRSAAGSAVKGSGRHSTISAVTTDIKRSLNPGPPIAEENERSILLAHLIR
jgi:hypothetical protein